MFDVLLYLSYLPMAAVLAVGFAYLVRFRHRSRKAAGLAFAGLGGLGGLWLLGIVFWATRRSWQDEMSTDTMSKVLSMYFFAYTCANAACILLLVVAVLTDRRSPAQSQGKVSGPFADFDDATANRRPH